MAGATRFQNGVCDQYDDPRGDVAFVTGVTTLCSPAFNARASTADEKCWTAPDVRPGLDAVADGAAGPIVCWLDEAQRANMTRIKAGLSTIAACDCRGFETCNRHARTIGCRDCARAEFRGMQVPIGVCEPNSSLIFVFVVAAIALVACGLIRYARSRQHSTPDAVLDDLVWGLRTPCRKAREAADRLLELACGGFGPRCRRCCVERFRSRRPQTPANRLKPRGSPTHPRGMGKPGPRAGTRVAPAQPGRDGAGGRVIVVSPARSPSPARSRSPARTPSPKGSVHSARSRSPSPPGLERTVPEPHYAPYRNMRAAAHITGEDAITRDAPPEWW